MDFLNNNYTDFDSNTNDSKLNILNICSRHYETGKDKKKIKSTKCWVYLRL